jgi:exosortase A-associated hydrolase 1
MRKLIEFPCAGVRLLGTLDTPDVGSARETGLLIVSGGNEIRIGAHRGMALLAQRLAAAGVPVFRFDRRGIGDSGGENHGFQSSAPDIAAAAATFTAETGVKNLAAFGNCDAATALALFGHVAGIDRLILANPWTIEDADDLPPAAAIRARYAAKLRDPAEWLRAARGGVSFRKLAGGLRKVSQKHSQQPQSLAACLTTALATWETRVTVLLAKDDATAIAFQDAVSGAAVETRDTASHSFAQPGDADWLFARVMAAISAA